MNKLSKKDVFKYATFARNLDGQENVIRVGAINYLIDQLDEPEKPVVPQFVAKYIEIQREYGHENIRIAIKRIEGRGEHSRLFNWFFFENNSDLFAKAWLYGYVVEETLYYMPLPYQSNNTIYYYKQDDGKISFKQGGMMKDHSKFTQEELDKYFPEIKHMAEEVRNE